MKDDLYPFQLPLSVIISATVTFCRLGGAEEDERSLHHLGSAVLLFELALEFIHFVPELKTLFVACPRNFTSCVQRLTTDNPTHHPHHQ